jgi:Tfp pilus assembly protein PilX
VEANRGVALILALLVLAFLTTIGGALLATSTIDIWISDNYKTAVQALYLAEAGIDDARELLRQSGRSPGELLAIASGPDHLLMTADDRPVVPSRQLTDSSGQVVGNYQVWLRNDGSDGAASLTDSNQTLTLLSSAQVGRSQKAIEVLVQKGAFPETETDARLTTVAAVERLASAIRSNATVYTGVTLQNFGGASDYRVAVVDGNLELGPGTGYGILLVRGELTIAGDVIWNGLLLVIGQGRVHTNPGVIAVVNGGLYLVRTRAADGSVLSGPAGGVFMITDLEQIRRANQSLPYNPIAMREK